MKEVGPTGDPNCPAYVRLAKKCNRDIFKKAEMQIGGDDDQSLMELKGTNLQHTIEQEDERQPLLAQNDESQHSKESSNTEELLDKVLVRRSPRLKGTTTPIYTPSPQKEQTKRKRVTKSN